MISLGCPKNLVDSERMLGKLSQDGYALVPDADGADVVVVNTCGFIEPARQESMAVIQEMLAHLCLPTMGIEFLKLVNNEQESRAGDFLHKPFHNIP